ncbi:hypothetical protein CVIRNUC_009812 [Coccomyxa viridis]|uniref:Uncharacterized protein n=1 Tax=Coccomyxa viridis TaxID=1274662 RepID=A0AAV1IKZ2_9CHLO|nr:hypothetical protein CVIRNUC_009812 [Coccomyxa viridis]
MQTSMKPVADISYTWRQRARSSFEFCYPKAEKKTEPQNCVNGSSGLKDLSCKSSGLPQHEQAAMAQGFSTGCPDTRQLPGAAAGSEPQSRSAAGVPVHEGCKRQPPNQADPSSQLSATEREFIAETTRAAELISRVRNYQQSGPLKLAREDLATLRELNALADPEAAFQSVICRVQSRADKLVKSGRIADAAKLLEACAAETGWTQGYALAAKCYQAVHVLSAAKHCLKTAVAADEHCVGYLAELIGVCYKLGDHASLAPACTKLLKLHSWAHDVRELRALANYRLGKHALYYMDVKKLCQVPEWKPNFPELAALVRQGLMDRDKRKGKGKGKRMK